MPLCLDLTGYLTMSMMRLMFVAFAAALPLTAQAQGGQEPDSSAPRSVVLSGAVDVPLLDSGIPGATLPVIAVMVNGRGPFRFGVETGAPFVAVTRDFVDSLKLQRVGGEGDFPEYMLDSMTFGAASFRGVRIASVPRSPRGVDGVLGLPFFRNVTFTIDYPANRFRLTRDTLPATNGRDILPISHAGPLWAMPISLAGQSSAGVIDTRSMASISLTPAGAAPLPFDGELRVVGRSAGAGIPDADVREGQLRGDAKIGAYTFPTPALSVRELPPQFPLGAVIGSVVLRNFVVSLDQRRQRIRLARQGATTIPLPGVRASLSTAGAVPGAATRPNETGGIAGYTGSYGDRTFSVADGKLFIQRPGGRLLELVATGQDAFSIVGIPQAKIEFSRDAAGRVVEVRVLNQQGQWERVRRDSTERR